MDKLKELVAYLDKLEFPKTVKLASLVCVVLAILADHSFLSIAGLLVVLYAINRELGDMKSEVESIKNSHNVIRMRREPPKGK